MSARRTTLAATGVVIACTLGNFVSATPMVNSVFGVFLVPLSKAFGWPRAEVSGVLALIAIAAALLLSAALILALPRYRYSVQGAR